MRSAASVLVTIALLVLAAAATPEGLAVATRRPVSRIELPAAPVLARYLVLVLAVLMVLVALYGAVVLVGGETRQRRAPRAPIWVQISLFLLTVWAVAQIQEALRARGGGAAAPVPEPTAGVADRVTSGTQGGGLAGLAATAALALAVVAAIAVFVILARREPRRGDGRGPSPSALVVGIEAGIEDLDAIPDPRRAVISCYARMEGALQEAGLERRPSDTPFELLSRALTSLRMPVAEARRLTELFERARFSSHEIDEAMRVQALASLRAVRAGVGTT